MPVTPDKNVGCSAVGVNSLVHLVTSHGDSPIVLLCPWNRLFSLSLLDLIRKMCNVTRGNLNLNSIVCA